MKNKCFDLYQLCHEIDINLQKSEMKKDMKKIDLMILCAD